MAEIPSWKWRCVRWFGDNAIQTPAEAHRCRCQRHLMHSAEQKQYNSASIKLQLCFVLTGWPQTWNTSNTHGFLRTRKTRRILREFCATSGKNCNKQSIFSLSFKYLVRGGGDLLYYWSWCGITLDEGHYTFTFCRDNVRKSKFMALKKPGKCREFFSPTLWPPCLRWRGQVECKDKADLSQAMYDQADRRN